jgi:hypothetical protein
VSDFYYHASPQLRYSPPVWGLLESDGGGIIEPPPPLHRNVTVGAELPDRRSQFAGHRFTFTAFNQGINTWDDAFFSLECV